MSSSRLPTRGLGGRILRWMRCGPMSWQALGRMGTRCWEERACYRASTNACLGYRRGHSRRRGGDWRLRVFSRSPRIRTEDSCVGLRGRLCWATCFQGHAGLRKRSIVHTGQTRGLECAYAEIFHLLRGCRAGLQQAIESISEKHRVLAYCH